MNFPSDSPCALVRQQNIHAEGLIEGQCRAEVQLRIAAPAVKQQQRRAGVFAGDIARPQAQAVVGGHKNLLRGLFLQPLLCADDIILIVPEGGMAQLFIKICPQRMAAAAGVAHDDIRREQQNKRQRAEADQDDPDRPHCFFFPSRAKKRKVSGQTAAAISTTAK